MEVAGGGGAGGGWGGAKARFTSIHKKYQNETIALEPSVINYFGLEVWLKIDLQAFTKTTKMKLPSWIGQ